MKKTFLAIALATMVFSGRLALADYDSCVAATDKEYSDCVANANTITDEIDRQSANAICANASANSRKVCDDAEAQAGGRSSEPAPEQPPQESPPQPEPQPQPEAP